MKTTLFRVCRIILVAMIAAAVVLSGLYALRWPLLGGRVRSIVISSIEAALDADVSLGKGTGSLVSGVSFADMSITPRSDSPLPAPVKIGLVTIEYSGALSGSSPRMTAIQLDDISVSGLRATTPPRREWAQTVADSFAFLETLEDAPRIGVNGCELRFEGIACSLAEVNVGGVNGRVSLAASGFELRVAGHTGSVERLSATVGAREPAVAVQIRGELDGRRVDFTAAIGRPRGGSDRRVSVSLLFGRANARFDGALQKSDDDVYRLRGGFDAEPNSIDFAAVPQGLRELLPVDSVVRGKVAFDLATRRLDIDAAMRWGASGSSRSRARPPFRVGYDSGKARLSVCGTVGGPAETWRAASLECTVERPQAFGITADRATLSGSYDGAMFALDQAELVRGRDTVKVSGAIRPSGDASFGYAIDLDELGPYFAGGDAFTRAIGRARVTGRFERRAGEAKLTSSVELRGLAPPGNASPSAWRIAGDVSYSPASIEISGVVVDGLPGDIALTIPAISARSDGRTWRADSVVLRAEGASLTCSASVGPAGRIGVTFDGGGAVPSSLLPEQVMGLGDVRLAGSVLIDERSVVAQGSVAMHEVSLAAAVISEVRAAGSVSYAQLDPESGWLLHCEVPQLRVSGGESTMDFAGSVRADADAHGGTLEIVPIEASFLGQPIRFVTPALVCRARWNDSVSLEKASFTWNEIDVSVAAALNGLRQHASVAIRCADLSRVVLPSSAPLSGAAAASLTLEGFGDRGEVTASLTGSRVSAFAVDLGTVRGDAVFQWPPRPGLPEITAEARCREGTVETDIRFRGPLSDVGRSPLTLIEVLVKSGDLARVLPKHMLPVWRTATLWTRADLSFVAQGSDAGLTGRGRAWLEGRPSIRSFEGGDDSESPSAADGFAIPFGLSRGVLSVGPAETQTGFGRLAVRGTLHADLAAFVSQPSSDPDIDLELSLRGCKLGLMKPLLRNVVGELPVSGTLDVIGSITGSIVSPAFGLTAEVSGGRIEFPSPYVTLEDIGALVRADSRGVRLERLEASAGGGRVKAEGELPDMTGDLFSVRVSGRDILLISDAESGIRVRADAQLRIEGTPEKVTVRGDLDVPMAQVYLEPPPRTTGEAEAGRVMSGEEYILSSVATELPLAPQGGVALPTLPGLELLDVDVNVTSAGGIRIQNSTVAAVCDSQLRLTGSAAALSLSGSLSARTGEVRVFPGTFLPISRLVLSAPALSGAEPTIDFRGDVVSGLTRLRVDIIGALSAPALSASSDPAFPGEELLALLAFGRPLGSAREGQTESEVSFQVARALASVAFDRMPRAEVPSGPWSRVTLDWGRQGSRGSDPLSWERPGAAERGTVLRAEYAVNPTVSIVSERDELGQMRGDIQFRRRMGAPRDTEPASPASHSEETILTGPASAPEIVFSGARAVSVKDLERAALPYVTRAGGAPTSESATDAAFAVEREYRLRGHHFARVEARLSDGAVVLQIAEGPRVGLGSVRFTGNRSIASSRLQAVAALRLPGARKAVFANALIDLQRSALLNEYLAEGYLRARIGRPQLTFARGRRRVDIVYEIEEGPRVMIGLVRFEGVPEEDIQDVSDAIVRLEGRPAAPAAVAAAVASARARFRAARGFDARFDHGMSVEGDRAELVVRVVPEARLRARSVEVDGCKKTTPEFIRKVADLEGGDMTSASGLRESELRLASSGLFRSARVRRLTDAAPGAGEASRVEEAVDVVIDVAELEPWELRSFVGYDTFDGSRVGVEIATINAFGRGERFRAGVAASERHGRVDAEMSFPSLAARRRTVSLYGFGEQRRDVSYSLINAGFVPSALQQGSSGTALRAGMRFERFRTFDVADDFPTEALLDFAVAAPFVSSTIDRRDNSLMPKSGYLATAFFEFADDSVLSDISYARLACGASAYASMGSSPTIALALKGGAIAPSNDTEEIPLALRFFAGGVGSVRGFAIRSLGPQAGGLPLGGEAFVAAQFDLRFRLWGDLHGAVFVDAGNVFARVEDVSTGDLRFGRGAGIRYHTPAGAILLDFGNNAWPRDGEPEWVVHFSFGLPF